MHNVQYTVSPSLEFNRTTQFQAGIHGLLGGIPWTAEPMARQGSELPDGEPPYLQDIGGNPSNERWFTEFHHAAQYQPFLRTTGGDVTSPLKAARKSLDICNLTRVHQSL